MPDISGLAPLRIARRKDMIEFTNNREFVGSHISSRLTEMEKRILEIVNRQLLVSVEELLKAMEREELDGAEAVLNRLREEGFLNIVEPLGKTSYVITQKGMRALKVK